MIIKSQETKFDKDAVCMAGLMWDEKSQEIEHIFLPYRSDTVAQVDKANKLTGKYLLLYSLWVLNDNGRGWKQIG
jgi:hypothetical protein